MLLIWFSMISDLLNLIGHKYVKPSRVIIDVTKDYCAVSPEKFSHIRKVKFSSQKTTDLYCQHRSSQLLSRSCNWFQRNHPCFSHNQSTMYLIHPICEMYICALTITNSTSIGKMMELYRFNGSKVWWLITLL